MSSCAEEASAAGAERAAHGELAPASGAARQQQTRDVGTGNQQDEADRAEQHEQRAAHVADERLLQRFHRRGLAIVGVRILAREAVADGRAVRRGLGRTVTLCRSRAAAWKYCTSRCAMRSPSMATGAVGTACGASTHRSTRRGWTNEAGMTPRTVVGMPFSRMVLPTTSADRDRAESPRASRRSPRRVGPPARHPFHCRRGRQGVGGRRRRRTRRVVSSAVSRTGSPRPVRSTMSSR